MKNLDSTRIHLDIAKNRPFSEDCVKRFNKSLKGFTHGKEYFKRRWREIKNAIGEIDRRYKIFTRYREQVIKLVGKFAPRESKESESFRW